jgi:hypothetical protein
MNQRRLLRLDDLGGDVVTVVVGGGGEADVVEAGGCQEVVCTRSLDGNTCRSGRSYHPLTYQMSCILHTLVAGPCHSPRECRWDEVGSVGLAVTGAALLTEADFDYSLEP